MQLFQRILLSDIFSIIFLFSDIILVSSAIDFEIPMVQINNQIGGFGKI